VGDVGDGDEARTGSLQTMEASDAQAAERSQPEPPNSPPEPGELASATPVPPRNRQGGDNGTEAYRVRSESVTAEPEMTAPTNPEPVVEEEDDPSRPVRKGWWQRKFSSD
jgi:hypothetical protein